MFRCPMAGFVWCWSRDVLGWANTPRNLDDFFFLLCNIRTNPIKERIKLTVLAAVCWWLWLTRDNMVFMNGFMLYSAFPNHFYVAAVEEAASLWWGEHADGADSKDERDGGKTKTDENRSWLIPCLVCCYFSIVWSSVLSCRLGRTSL